MEYLGREYLGKGVPWKGVNGVPWKGMDGVP